MSEQLSSFREGAGYDEVYPSSRGSEGLTQSPEREPFAHSLDEGEEEEYEAEERENDKGEEGKEREDEEEEESKGSHEDSDESRDQTDGKGSRPFILPKIWMVNDFYPTMSQKVLNTLRDRH